MEHVWTAPLSCSSSAQARSCALLYFMLTMESHGAATITVRESRAASACISGCTSSAALISFPKLPWSRSLRPAEHDMTSSSPAEPDESCRRSDALLGFDIHCAAMLRSAQSFAQSWSVRPRMVSSVCII